MTSPIRRLDSSAIRSVGVPADPASERPRRVGKALAFGAMSALLYALMYLYEDMILRWTTQGRWYFIVPVGAAFLLSFVHGRFTGCFWEVLGVRAKPPAGK